MLEDFLKESHYFLPGHVTEWDLFELNLKHYQENAIFEMDLFNFQFQ